MEERDIRSYSDRELLDFLGLPDNATDEEIRAFQTNTAIAKQAREERSRAAMMLPYIAEQETAALLKIMRPTESK